MQDSLSRPSVLGARMSVIGRSFGAKTLLAAAMVFASAAFAAAAPLVAPTPVLSEDLQQQLSDIFGEGEGAYLQRETMRYVAAALARRGAMDAVDTDGAVTVEITIVRATPNRPTMTQLRETPGLSMQSISLGGAEFIAVIRDSAGAERARVTHEHFSRDIEDADGMSVWGDARIAMRGFARKVAEAYAAIG